MNYDPSRPDSPPNLNNMGGADPRKVTINPVASYWCGFDYLTLTVCADFGARWATDAAKQKNWRAPGGGDIEWVGDDGVVTAQKDTGYETLRDLLVRYRQLAIDSREAVDVPELGDCRMHPDGGSLGSKGGASKRLDFKLELDCAMVLIADQPKYRGQWPNIKVEIKGERCLTYDGGAVEAYKYALDFVEYKLGASIHKERVGRVDFCADFPGIDMQVVIDAAMSHHYTCQSSLLNPYLKPGASSIYWGSGTCQLRIYDKLGEMRAKDLKGNPGKYLYMIKKRWGGVEPLFAIRVEYQVSSDSLRAFGITDFDSLMEKGGDVIRYLVGCDNVTFDRWNKKKKKYVTTENARWFRMLTDKPSKHSEKNITHPFWELVQNVFLQNYAKPEKVVSINPDEADVIALMKQAFGVSEAAMCAKGFAVKGKESVSPKKYPQPKYEIFEKFACMFFRHLAVNSGRWEFEEVPDVPPDTPEVIEKIYEQFLLDLGNTKDRKAYYE